MAEKEEKIYVYRFTEDDGICPLEEICTKFPGQCGHCKEIPTRTEAIKKISSHLLMCDISTMDTDEIAEAAINALLDTDIPKDNKNQN